MVDITVKERINKIALQYADHLKDSHIKLHSLYIYGSYAKDQ
jgi:hypothetical protein